MMTKGVATTLLNRHVLARVQEIRQIIFMDNIAVVGAAEVAQRTTHAQPIR